jgi:hypothetical protein
MSHPSEYPYSVRTSKFSTLVKGHDTWESAEKDTKVRNERAKELCLDIRYEATVIPASRSKKEG